MMENEDGEGKGNEKKKEEGGRKRRTRERGGEVIGGRFQDELTEVNFA